MPRQFELVGGPLDGGCHELHAHVDPDMVGSFGQDDPNGRDIHWYRLGNDGRAYFEETQKNSTGALLPSLERLLEECTAAQRLEVLKPYCRVCGQTNKKCKCDSAC
jgi:hypothetical protein